MSNTPRVVSCREQSAHFPWRLTRLSGMWHSRRSQTTTAATALSVYHSVSMTMGYQTMKSAHEGMPLLREKGTAEVVEEKGGRINELNGSSMSRRSRKGAAFGLIVLALGSVSALAALLGGKTSSQSECSASVPTCTRQECPLHIIRKDTYPHVK